MQGVHGARKFSKVSPVHSAMLSTLPLNVVASRRDKRIKVDEKKADVVTKMEVRSPLTKLTAKTHDKLLENLNPFWAIVRCACPKSLNNMELETIACTDLGFEVPGSKFEKSGLKFVLDVPILRNICVIAQGEILSLPFSDK